MENKVTVLRKEIYDIPTPSSLTIGDGSYLEQIASKPKRETRNLRELVFMDDSIPAVRRAKLIFREVLIEFESDEEKTLFPDGMRQFVVNLVVSNKEYIDTFVDDKYFPKALKARKNLGCDMASFDIVVGHRGECGVRSDTVDTGSDGLYGYVLVNQVPFGFVVNLYLNADYVSESRLKSSLAYLFKCKELGMYEDTVTYQVKLVFLWDTDQDVKDAMITVPMGTDIETVRHALQNKHAGLDGVEAYFEQGRNPETLLNEVCRENGWTWEETRFDLVETFN